MQLIKARESTHLFSVPDDLPNIILLLIYVEWFFRGNPIDYNSWYDAGFNGWNWTTVYPYFLKSEGLQSETITNNPQLAAYHNTTGPVKVSQFLFADPNDEEKLQILSDSLAENNFKIVEDYNGEDQLGVSKTFFTHSTPPGVRYSTAQAFLIPSKDRENFYVLKNATANKILIENKTARGVEITVNGETINVYASKELISSAGSINTPKLLISSGIGPKDDVEKLGLELVADLPVGLGMTDHVNVPIIFTGNTTSIESSSENYFSLDGLPFPSLNGFFSLDNDTQPEIQITTFYLNQSSPLLESDFKTAFNYNDDVVNSIKDASSKSELFQFNIILLHPKSSGKVVVKNVAADPDIHLNYLSHQDDFITYRKGIRRLLNLTETTYLKNVNSSLVKWNLTACDSLEYLSDDYWDCFIRETVVTIWHPSGTAAMGKVVDENLKVYGVDNLRVADASIMPSLPSGNTNAPCMMIGEKIADVIKNKYGA